MDVHDYITISIASVALIISIATFVTAKFKLRNSQRTTIYGLQIQKVQEIIEHIDLLIREIYSLRVLATSFGNDRAVKTPEKNLKEYRSLRMEYIRMVRRNSIILPDKIIDELVLFNKYILEQFEPSKSPNTDVDISCFKMIGTEKELNNKYESLISFIREEFHVDGLSNETFNLISKSK